MNYERTGNVLHDDIALLLGDLQNQMAQSEWNMLPVDSLHGFLTAIAIGPRLVMPSVWLPRVFFERNELPEFKDEKQAQKVMHAILNVYNGVLKTIKQGMFSPFISFSENNDKDKKDLSLWCKGFLLGTSTFDESEWDIFNDSDLAELCLPIVYNSQTDRLKEIYTKEQLKEMEALGKESVDLIFDAVYDIRDYFNDSSSPPLSKPLEESEPKIGRNEPCPCGSGKKYKKCCGK